MKLKLKLKDAQLNNRAIKLELLSERAVREELEKLIEELPHPYGLWATTQTPITPKEYALPTFFTMISALIGERLGCDHGDETLRPNLWTWLIGPSRCGKSTIINRAWRILDEVNEVRLLGLGGTYQGLRNRLVDLTVAAGKEEGIEGCIVEDDMTQFFPSLRSEVQRGAGGFFCKLKDNSKAPIESYLVGQGDKTIPGGRFITWLSGVTPELLFSCIGREEVVSGFVPRFRKAFGRRECGGGSIAPKLPPEVKKEIIDALKEIRTNVIGKLQPGARFVFALGDGTDTRRVYDKWVEWMKKQDVLGDNSLDSLQQAPLEYAMLLTPLYALEQFKSLEGVTGEGEVEINSRVMRMAVRLSLLDVAFQMRFQEMGLENNDDPKFSRRAYDILEWLRRSPGITRQTIGSRYRSGLTKRVLYELEYELGLVESKKGPTPGRWADVFFLKKEVKEQYSQMKKKDLEMDVKGSVEYDRRRKEGKVEYIDPPESSALPTTEGLVVGAKDAGESPSSEAESLPNSPSPLPTSPPYAESTGSKDVGGMVELGMTYEEAREFAGFERLFEGCAEGKLREDAALRKLGEKMSEMEVGQNG